MDELYRVTYGSRLYGTSTTTSDTDVKVVYLPNINDVLLGKRMPAFKKRYDVNGNQLPDSASMPENGVETEYITFQTFVRDFVAGQTYAVEMAWALYDEPFLGCGPTSKREMELLRELVDRFSTNEVYSMVGFAMKQTFDYVRRGERLNEAKRVLEVLQEMNAHWEEHQDVVFRLDSVWTSDGDVRVLDEIVARTGLSMSTSVNNNRTQRTLELNGRSYLESTAVEHVAEQLRKMVKQYGERSTKASETDVDFKSLSHAVRVYQQAIELLDTGRLTFPRKNFAELLRVKQGLADLDEVKTLLLALDDEVQAKMLTSTMRKKTPELQAQAEQWLLSVLRELYDLA